MLYQLMPTWLHVICIACFLATAQMGCRKHSKPDFEYGILRSVLAWSQAKRLTTGLHGRPLLVDLAAADRRRHVPVTIAACRQWGPAAGAGRWAMH